ncbi:MAG: PIN domain-containing protein [Verrucomicrobia bacterium]|nr:PIN domain-containing protein [Verrucomicrobiota bacterium]
MAAHLLDTNILLRFCDSACAEHSMVRNTITMMWQNGEETFVTPQNFIEFWAVATRPVGNNGLGWTSTQTRQELDQVRNQFPLLEDKAEVFPRWLDLVTTHQIKGKKVHDARLAAVMFAHGLTHLLTLNPSDFDGIPGLTLVHPANIPAPPPVAS